jgi:hypothetical protein
VNNLEKFARSHNKVSKNSEFEIMSLSFGKVDTQLDYNQIYYNCEHFVTECVYGSAFSSRTEVKWNSWNNVFVIKYLKLLFFYMLLINFWRFNYEIIEPKLTEIVNEWQLDLYSERLQSFVLSSYSSESYHDLNFIILTILSALIIFIGVLIIDYNTR